ncbi:hypothetical protein LZG04_41080 [Saccharothrix sp. S26]|uniref:polymorphic toxin-type HINT domain-containing protein n=1 Tax=Saccharothrix sp. S26 TaxID=2907215 RepID=UPI001F339858|nr:polymorphic toxin-type HINT domain-containing protein [Saccharothrix sp. S26]MCE7001170.1 hypothetical protein [Saccharothrix sp. S26]
MTREKAQILLDVLGLRPFLGEPIDLMNCGIHAAYGEAADAAMSCGAAVPIAGWIATGDTRQGPETIRTTAYHPFYDVGSHDWVQAGKLQPGTELSTPGGGHAEVVAGRYYEAELRTYNLSVDVVPTFYVLAGAVPVLVHNTGPCEHIALGLQDARDNPMALDEFAMERGAATYHDWPGKGPWHEKLHQFLAPDSSTKISFNLDGIDDAVASARNGKAVDPSGFEGLTNWELYRIS